MPLRRPKVRADPPNPDTATQAMNLGSLFQVIMFQLVTARDAPYPIALGALVTALVVWVLTRWWYRSRIANLKRAIVRRDGELAKLRVLGPQAASAAADTIEGEPPADEPVRAAPRSDERRALRVMANAIDQAETALASNDPRDIDRALSSVALALQTTRATFDLTVPDLADDAAASLRAGKVYLERVRPALRAGDVEEARRLAAEDPAGADDRRIERTSRPG